FQLVDNAQSEALRQIDEIAVVRHDFRATICSELLLPFGQFAIESHVEFCQIGAVGRRVLGIDLREMVSDVARYDLDGYRVDHEVRIPERVNVALGAIEAGWNLQQPDSFRRHDTAGRARADLAVACVLQQRGEPAELQLSAAFNQGIGAVEGD